MSLALTVQTVNHELRTKKAYLIATPSGNYQGPTTAVPTTQFTQSAAGAALKGPTAGFIVGSALSGSVTFSTSGGTGAGTQAVNMATYTNLTSATPATATAAAVALALALTSGALGTASGSVYTGTITHGVLSIATNTGAEVLSITVSSLVETTPGGDTVNLQAITPTIGQTDATIGYPGIITMQSVMSSPAGCTALLVPGTTLNNWKLRIFTAENTELATGAYPAEILAGVFILFIEGPKGRL